MSKTLKSCMILIDELVQSYPSVTNYLSSALFRWAGDAKTFNGDTCIELVCSPNNPDGSSRKPVAKSGKAAHDLAYYWPQYTAITEAAGHDIMLFTVSKCTGHAGTRLGYTHTHSLSLSGHSPMLYFSYIG
jgi:L-tryptophan---pyruvate aminotransferase